MRHCLLDTGPLVAALRRGDTKDQTWARKQIRRLPKPLLTCDAVIAEASHFLGGPVPVLHTISEGLIVNQFDSRPAADQLLAHSGYAKNHFAHYARPEDRNLYYNHARRKEDLLGLGPTADGVLGIYHYRHADYHAYIARADSDIPELEGGIRESSSEQYLHPLIVSLMTARISRAMIRDFHLESLFEKWQKLFD